jgi:hypothetical protein
MGGVHATSPDRVIVAVSGHPVRRKTGSRAAKTVIAVDSCVISFPFLLQYVVFADLIKKTLTLYNTTLWHSQYTEPKSNIGKLGSKRDGLLSKHDFQKTKRANQNRINPFVFW